ncbi:hypothetical protein CHY_0739 [Carboxydothermus hydrogenoformans Z-2901]|uniref:Uncharacterized protein n=1 Tax=Carboxydothermus hydrogenoformans (strain ATCC BAA-161 / DSM 6008 / Z-2901) TaxID=246194 RepID=Q3AE41_CARHZ|nr:hypothetical protein CHY_0739 [Carboxydothermus hydrogenoformans Z-2901]
MPLGEGSFPPSKAVSIYAKILFLFAGKIKFRKKMIDKN